VKSVKSKRYILCNEVRQFVTETYIFSFGRNLSRAGYPKYCD
jgi:hypothetical protein